MELTDEESGEESLLENQSGGIISDTLGMFRRNPQLMKVLILAGLQQGFCNLAQTFVFSNLRVQYWGEHMSEYQSVASIMISFVAVIFGGPFGRFSDAVDRRVAVGLFAAGTFLPGWALQIFGETSSGLWISTLAQIIGSFGLTSNVMFSMATDVTNSKDRELMAGAYFALMCVMNVVLISIPVLLIMVLKVVNNNMELIVCVQTLGTVLFFLVLCTVQAEKEKEAQHDNEMWMAEGGGGSDVNESEPPAKQDWRQGICGILRGLVQPFFLAFGHRRLRRLCLTTFLLGFGGSLVNDIGGQFFNQCLGLIQHPDESKVVMVSIWSMLPGQIMAIPGNIITGYIAKQAGPLKVLRMLIPIAALLVAVGAFMAVVQQMWYIAVVVICLTYAGMPNVPLQRIVAGVAPPGRTGEALAANGVFQMLAGLLGNMAVATLNPMLLSSSMPNPLWVYYPVCGLLVLMAILPLIGTPRGGWGAATGSVTDQIHAISWADGALFRWYYFAMRQRMSRQQQGSSVKSYISEQDLIYEYHEEDAFLPEVSKREYEAAFKLFDHEGTGRITKSDIGAVLKAAGNFPTDEDIEKFMTKVDTDGDGTLSYEEFLHMLQRLPQERDFEAELIEAFKILDENADGFLSIDELEKGAKLFHHPWTREDIMKMIEEADVSHDEKVSFPEFERIMKWGMAMKISTDGAVAPTKSLKR